MNTLKPTISVGRTASFLVASGTGILAVTLCATATLAQTTYHVARCGDDTWTGTSSVCVAPDGPKRTIQAGINASVDGDVVLVADGEYTGPGNRDMDYAGRAITVRGAGGASVCIIDCDASALDPHRAFHFHSGETETSVLEGFTIQNGSMPAGMGDMPFGGAVYCEGGAPTIRACTFHRNTASWGAAVNAAGTSLRLVRCTFTENTAGNVGGAIYAGGVNLSLIDCTFVGNTAAGDSAGGAISVDSGTQGTYTNCAFIRNSTTEVNLGGGAISCWAASGNWTNCSFIENSAGRFGGGVYVTRGSQATFTDCAFLGNSGQVGGGASVSFDSQVTLTNCLFTANRNATEERPGAALSVSNGPGGPASVSIVNCTFSRNVAPASGAALTVAQTSSASATNCVLWDNALAQILVEPTATASVSFSDIQGGWSGTGNISGNPLFVRTPNDGGDGWFDDPNTPEDERDNNDYGDLRLSPFSPCIDAGNNSALDPAILTDLDGLRRFHDDPWTLDTGLPDPARTKLPIVDMGAYEFQGNSCIADFNNDGFLNSQDFFDFLAAFFASDAAADFNRDTFVNSQDFFDFLTAFFVGCA